MRPPDATLQTLQRKKIGGAKNGGTSAAVKAAVKINRRHFLARRAELFNFAPNVHIREASGGSGFGPPARSDAGATLSL